MKTYTSAFMKKKGVLWSLIALIAISLSFLLIHKYSPRLTSDLLLFPLSRDEGSVKSLQYIFYIPGKGPQRAFSLEVDNSDFMDNIEVLNNLWGPL